MTSWPSVGSLLGGTATGAVAGFLVRPCCVVPVVLSAAGVGSAGLAESLAALRPILLATSSLVLAASLVMTFRRSGGWLVKMVTVGATLMAFVLWLEIA